MIIPPVGSAVDERLPIHRLKSTSLAGVVGGVPATGLFAWHCDVDRTWSRDHFAVAAAVAAVKPAAKTWYRLEG